MKFRVSAFLFLVLVTGLAIAGCRLINPGGNGETANISSSNTLLSGLIRGDAALIAPSLKVDTTPVAIRAAAGDPVPIPNAEVWLEDLPFFPHQYTDSTGKYTFTNVPPGTHRVIASFTKGLQQYKVRSTQTVVNALIENTVSPVDLLAATRRVTGILRNPLTGALYPAGTKIVIWGEIIVLGSDGTFTSPLLPEGLVETVLSVLPVGIDTTLTGTIPASSTVTISLGAAGDPVQIEVQVTPPGTENPSGNLPPVATIVAKNAAGTATSTVDTTNKLYLTVTAVDPEGKTLTVTWSADSGTAEAYTPPANIRALTGTEQTFTGRFTPAQAGTPKITATLKDPEGNETKAIIQVTVTQALDTVAPAAPTVAGIVAGTFNTDQTFTVAGEAGATIQYSTDNGTTWQAYSAAVTLSGAGTYNVIARQTDATGNPSVNSVVITLTIDKTAPTVALVVPADNALNTAVNTSVTIAFSEAMDADTLTTTNITLDQGGTGVAGTVSVNDAKTVATFTPSAALTNGLVYTVTVKTDVKDAAGNALAVQKTTSFTTAALPTSIAINPATGFVAIGRSSQMTAIGTYANGSTADVTTQVIWSSSDTGKATVVPTTGIITGVAVGQTTLTATFPGGPTKTATVNVDVSGFAPQTTTYAWEEISVTGTNPAWEAGGGVGDDEFAIIDLSGGTPFNFSFFGNTYNTFYPNSNGAIIFGAGSFVFTFPDIPNVAVPNNFIAVWATDFIYQAGEGKLFYQVKGTAPDRRLIIQWEKFRHINDGANVNTVTFQAILHETSNSITFQYKDVLTGNVAIEKGKTGTIGLENSDGSKGVKFSFNEASLSDGLAVLFQYQQP